MPRGVFGAARIHGPPRAARAVAPEPADRGGGGRVQRARHRPGPPRHGPPRLREPPHEPAGSRGGRLVPVRTNARTRPTPGHAGRRVQARRPRTGRASSPCVAPPGAGPSPAARPPRANARAAPARAAPWAAQPPADRTTQGQGAAARQPNRPRTGPAEGRAPPRSGPTTHRPDRPRAGRRRGGVRRGLGAWGREGARRGLRSGWGGWRRRRRPTRRRRSGSRPPRPSGW